MGCHFCSSNRSQAMVVSRRRKRLPPSSAEAKGGREAITSSAFYFKLCPIVTSSFIFFMIVSSVSAGVPRFFESNRMAVLLLPSDTEVDSIIYRLRAEDMDRNYPLYFQIVGPIGINLIYLETHGCTPSNDIFCEADVYLRQPVEVGRLYIFNLTVTDQLGYMTSVTARIDATSGRATPTSEIFIRYSPTVEVREDTLPKTIISTMTVKKRYRSTFGEFQILGSADKLFKMIPSNLVSPEAINGTLILENVVDYEEANLHTFKVCILQPYTDDLVDTRNIACVLMSVVVLDVQDEPPIFTSAPPVTRVPANAAQGDPVAKVEAKDGDRGIPRQIRYSILPETSVYTKFFRVDTRSGLISLNDSSAKLRDSMVSFDPILMTVTAEELTTAPDSYPALSSSVEIAFVILEAEFLAPKFVHESYIGEIYENSLPDSEVTFNSPFLVKEVKGLFSLELQGDKGAFTVVPGVVTDASDIAIKVKNSFLLNYETTPQMNFKLVARQIRGRQQASSSTDVTVRLLDVNDNAPQFSQQQYEVEIYENITRGTSILRVYATDGDSGNFGAIRYTHLDGPAATSLTLDPVSGVITCATDNHIFDRETAAEYIVTVEAQDNNGRGTPVNTATAKIVIRVKDVNDSPPRFEESIYKGVMAPDMERLRDAIRVRAYDSDAERPNNEIVYDLERNSYSDFFSIDRRTGYLDVRQNFLPRISGLNSEGKSRKTRALNDNDTVISLTVKATDLGDPPLSNHVDVKIFKQEYGERVVKFIYPKPPAEVRVNARELESTLNALTGGITEIMGVRSLLKSGYLLGDIDPNKSEVTALVRFGLDTVVNVEDLMVRLNNSEVHKLQMLSQERQVTITHLEDKNSSYIAGVVILCILLAVFILIILMCCLCEGCPLYRNDKSNMVGDDGFDGVNYVRVDENGKYRTNPDDPEWWKSMPQFMKEAFYAVGYKPPGRSRSREAWSADERQRYGRVTQPPEGGIVEDRGGMVQTLQRQREPLRMEDLDINRLARANAGRQPVRVDSRNSQFSEPRRVFVLKDAMGVPRGEESLQEGNTYLLEDLEVDSNMPRVNDARYRNGEYGDDLAYNQGNSQALRLLASQHDAAITNDRERLVRRADVEAGGAGIMADEGGGYVNRIHQNYNAENGQNFGPSSSPPNMEHYRSRMRNNEDVSTVPEANRSRSLKDRVRGKIKQFQPDTHQTDKFTETIDPNRNTRSARGNIPGTYGYQHTKTSILRYESNKAKIEEEREDKLRRGQDPDELCLTHQGLGGSFSESRKGSVRDSKRSNKANDRFQMPSGVRRNSLPEIETNLEREAARRHIRKSSSGGQEFYDDENYRGSNANKHVAYQAETATTEEIERRRQQRRSEASEALSEDFLGPRFDDVNAAIRHLQQQQQQLMDLQQQVQTQLQQKQLQKLKQDIERQQLLLFPQLSLQQQQLLQPLSQQQLMDTRLLQQQQYHPPSMTELGQQQSSSSQIVAVAAVHSEGGVVSKISDASTTDSNTIMGPSNTVIDTNVPTTVSTDQGKTGVTKEAIQNAIAAAVADMSTEGGAKQQSDKITNTAVTVSENAISGASAAIATTAASISNDGTANIANLNERDTSGSKRMQDKLITNDLNLPDDAKSLQSAFKPQTEEQSQVDPMEIIEKNNRNDASILNIPRDKRKRNRMLEKKSVFTIAYDGMKTDQLRPDSASADP